MIPSLQLPRRLERFLDLAEVLDPSAARARTALPTLLAPPSGATALDRDPWTFSRLMPDGFPVELAFCSSDASVRYTTEVGGPGVSPTHRLDLALQRLSRLGVEFTDQDRRALESVQPDLHPSSSAESCRDLADSWGAWVSGRHRSRASTYAGGSPSDEFKVYAQVRENGRANALQLLPTACRHALVRELALDPARVDVQPVMLGIQPRPQPQSRQSAYELYFRSHGLRPRHLTCLLRPLMGDGIDRACEHLEASLERLWGWPVFQRLPGRSHGFSYRWTGSDVGDGWVFTFYVFAEDLFDSDRRTRRALLDFAARENWDARLYDACTAPWESCVDSTPARHHGMLAFALAATTATDHDSKQPFRSALGVGLSPPN